MADQTITFPDNQETTDAISSAEQFLMFEGDNDGPLFDPFVYNLVNDPRENGYTETDFPGFYLEENRHDENTGKNCGSFPENSDNLNLMPIPMSPVPSSTHSCISCHTLREIFHINGTEALKLEIHGLLGIITHAIEERYSTDMSSEYHEYHKFDFRDKSISCVKQFLIKYCHDRRQEGYIILQDPLSSFYEALCVGLERYGNQDPGLFQGTKKKYSPSQVPDDPSSTSWRGNSSRLTKFGYINWRRLWETLKKEYKTPPQRTRAQARSIGRGEQVWEEIARLIEGTSSGPPPLPVREVLFFLLKYWPPPPLPVPEHFKSTNVDEYDRREDTEEHLSRFEGDALPRKFARSKKLDIVEFQLKTRARETILLSAHGCISLATSATSGSRGSTILTSRADMDMLISYLLGSRPARESIIPTEESIIPAPVSIIPAREVFISTSSAIVIFYGPARKSDSCDVCYIYLLENFTSYSGISFILRSGSARESFVPTGSKDYQPCAGIYGLDLLKDVLILICSGILYPTLLGSLLLLLGSLSYCSARKSISY
ncbi:hypothetical protein F511_21926 [Dorcoceras hygrometricum]|uniref:Uncharacterized protein n=1 Tax=Dorcoceras hygrometricum TaxID=472368 RepID=A0A2Z7CUY8_9LAMI|nr:hypothetical protein F511_21926 [Dorcoceras hygrometricum]